MLHLLITRLFALARRSRERRTAIRALGGLNDRLLRDIGIERHEIERTVHRCTADGWPGDGRARGAGVGPRRGIAGLGPGPRSSRGGSWASARRRAFEAPRP